MLIAHQRCGSYTFLMSYFYMSMTEHRNEWRGKMAGRNKEGVRQDDDRCPERRCPKTSKEWGGR